MILPCPFCGSEAESDLQRGFIAYDGQPGNAVAIYCSKCPADMSLCHRDHPQEAPEHLLAVLTTAWNFRTPPQGRISQTIAVAGDIHAGDPSVESSAEVRGTPPGVRD